MDRKRNSKIRVINWEKLPIFPQLDRFHPSKFLLVNLARWLSYLLRLFTPGAWLTCLLQREDKNGAFYTNPTVSELYQLASTAYPLGILVFEATLYPLQSYYTWVCIALILECVQYQFWNLVVRPAVDPDYRRYSTSRTLLIILLQYFELAFSFALIYKNLFPMQFHLQTTNHAATLSSWEALEFSFVTISTVGYGSIYATPGSGAGILAIGEALCGILGLGVMLATVVSGLKKVGEVE